MTKEMSTSVHERSMKSSTIWTKKQKKARGRLLSFDLVIHLAGDAMLGVVKDSIILVLCYIVHVEHIPTIVSPV